MREKLADALTAIPEERIPAAALGVVVSLALVLGGALYLPYQRWQQLYGTRLQMESQASNQGMMKQSVDQLIKELGPLEEQLPRSAASLDHLVMGVMRNVERLSSQHRLALSAVSPGAASPFLMLDEIRIAVELEGQYPNIVNWLHAINRLSPSLSLSQVTLKPGKAEEDVALSAVISAYQYRGEK